jgi:hypothetical protein
MLNKTYTSKVLEICKNGDAIVELPNELIKELDWQVGDKLDYKFDGESVVVINLSKNKQVVRKTPEAHKVEKN